MPVLCAPTRSVLEIFNITSRRGRIITKRIYVYVRGSIGKIVYEAVVFVSGNKRLNSRRHNTGLTVSKPSSGNRTDTINAASGAHITNINYYGTSYAAAKGDAATQMDPEKFTKPVMDLANQTLGPTLKSPTVEECGYSDRIMQLTAGNSTITTQEAACAVVAYGEWPSGKISIGQAVDKPSTPGTSVERFFTFDSIDWTTSYKGQLFHLPGCLKNMGVFGSNMTYHYLMNSGFVAHVQLNATKFHQGAILVCAIPECQLEEEPDSDIQNIPDTFHQTYPKAQCTIFPHQIINIRTNNAATIVMPYFNCVPSENGLTHNYWTLAIIPLVPLSYSSGASTVVPITVTIAPLNSYFSGLRNQVTGQGVPMFEVPGSGQFVTTLANTGYPALPHFEPSHGLHIPGEFVNFMEVCQIDTFCKAGDNELYFGVGQGRYTDHKPLKTWDMSLMSDLFNETYLSKFSKFYSQYRGSIKLTFLFTGSALTTGKFLIAYTPPGGDAPTDRESAMLATHAIWDIGLQSSFSFIIPWISATQYRFSNQSGNVYSYSGYITFFYQTALVTPPSTPQSSNILVMASACDDFEFRVATDNAYFQGLGDKLGKIISDSVETTMEKVTTKALEAPKMDSGLTIQTGEASALTAVETGASASTESTQLMETRDCSLTFSRFETSVTSFYSRYAKFFAETLDMTSTKPAMLVTELYFNKEKSTQLAVRTKYRMATYIRCHYDIVVVVHMAEVFDKSSAQPYVFQVIYVPPGAPVPGTWNSAEWSVPTTPSCYFKSTDPPASIRLPFISPSHAYATRYNGYSNFNTSSAQYGEYPGNFIGHLAIRTLSHHNNNDAVTGKFNVLMFARPVDVKVWGPRPIVSLKRTSRLAETRGRIEIVSSDSDGDLLHHHASHDGSDLRRRQAGPKKRNKKRRPQPGLAKTPDYNPKLPTFRYPYDLIHMFHGIPVTKRAVLIPFHLLQYDLLLQTMGGFTYEPYDVFVDDIDYDCAALVFKRDLFEPVQLCDPCDDYVYYSTCRTVNYDYTLKFTKYYELDNVVMDATPDVPEHVQYSLVEVNYPIPDGWCGSALYCRAGVIGIATGTSEDAGTFTYIKRIPWINELINGPKQQQGLPEEQGITDWFSDTAKNMAKAFGTSLTDTMIEEIKDASDGLDFKADIVKTLLLWLVKAVCACVIISKAEDKVSACVAVGCMLGADIISMSPFDWLKQKICSHFKWNHEQGVSEWIKEFNAACTAAKGLEWIGDKILQFVNWIKKIFARENKHKTKFMKQLEKLPELMENIDKIFAHRGAYSNDQIAKICKQMRLLKMGADIFGVERNHATNQIVKYYNKTLTLLNMLQRPRSEPVAILIHGAPGTGKSLATEALGRLISKRFGVEQPYCLPPDPKHFDGYCQQPVVIMDDVGQNPDGEDVKLFCQMVSTTNFQVPMAALEDKGICFTSHFVLASTNCQDLKPPTISEPKALERRFVLNLDVEIQDKYKVQGKLNASAALDKCSDVHTSVFLKCCPLFCGKAILFKDRKTGIRYSLDGIAKVLLDIHNSRHKCLDKLDAMFQGDPDCVCGGAMHHEMEQDSEEWFQTDFDEEPNVLKTYEEIAEETNVTLKPLPREVADLIRAIPDERIIKYCAQKGWLLSPETSLTIVRNDVRRMVNDIALGLTIVSSIAAIGMFVYFLFKLFSNQQGSYESIQKTMPKPPQIRRMVVEQGSNEFERSLLKRNLFPTVTEKGGFSGIGLFDKWMMLPTHAGPTSIVEFENRTYNVLDCVVLHNEKGPLEVMLVKLDRPVNFRDIRKYFITSFNSVKANLVVNSPRFEEKIYNVGRVTAFGFLNLSFHPVYNTCTYLYPTQIGQCGGLIVSGSSIVGMHIGGDGANGYAAIVTQKMFKVVEQGEIVKVEKSPKLVNVTTRTQLHPSPFFDVFPGTKEPAVLSEKDPRLSRYVNFEDTLFSKYFKNKDCKDEPTQNMIVAVKHYASQLKPLLQSTAKLSLEEVVYGTTNLEGLDLKTSAGWPYVTMGIKKKDLIPEKGQGLHNLIQALDLHGYDLPFVTYLKDELRPIEKVEQGRTRLIECASLNDTIRMKTVFGSLFKMMHANVGVATGSAVGCDPDVDWSVFYRQFKDLYLIGFDYSNYDGSLTSQWFMCLIMLLLELGYTEKDIKCIEHIVNSKHVYKDLLLTIEGGMPSGTSGTSIFNSMINNIIIRTLVLDVYKGIDLDHLKILAYGDDVMVGYVYPLDASLLAEQGTNYGLVMTPPDKSAYFNEINLENVTFLKRRFKPDETFPFLIHPVFPMEQVFESIRWSRNDNTLQEHILSLCQLAWHNGRDEYEDFILRCKSIPIGKMMRYPEFDVLRQNWLDKF
nr:polyprotein [Bovine picornavirus]